MLEKIPSKRLSARQAVQHGWFRGRDANAAENVASRINSAMDGQLQQFAESMPISRRNSLSEAELFSALQDDNTPNPDSQRYAPRTIQWWQERSVRALHLSLPRPPQLSCMQQDIIVRELPAVFTYPTPHQHRLQPNSQGLTCMCDAEAAGLEQCACEHDARQWQQSCQAISRSRRIRNTASYGLFQRRQQEGILERRRAAKAACPFWDLLHPEQTVNCMICGTLQWCVADELAGVAEVSRCQCVA